MTLHAADVDAQGDEVVRVVDDRGRLLFHATRDEVAAGQRLGAVLRAQLLEQLRALDDEGDELL